MHAVLLTVIALTGANGYEYNAAMFHGHGEVYHEGDAGYAGHGHHGRRPHGGCFGMMPQTCYNPRYGCYDGDRFNNRYPAFHGTYYRRPYNYRNLFDYPWHADLHEPTSQFSHHVEGQPHEVVVPAPQPPVPVPAAQRAPVGTGMRSASNTKSVIRQASSKAVPGSIR